MQFTPFDIYKMKDFIKKDLNHLHLCQQDESKHGAPTDQTLDTGQKSNFLLKVRSNPQPC
jgi:hypothetical protein